MDNLYVGNADEISGVKSDERTSIMTHWICAGANLMAGSDLTNMDAHGIDTLTNSGAQAVAAFTRRFSMQPRNPGSGGTEAKQLQAWIAGPSNNGSAVAVLANYGPDQGRGGFGTSLSGSQTVSITIEDLGLEGSFFVHDVWADQDEETVKAGVPLARNLSKGQSKLLLLTPVS